MDLNYGASINPYPSRDELSVLFSGHSQTSADHKVGPLVHSHHLLHYVLSGSGVFHCLGKEYRLEAGAAFFIYPGELVRYDADPESPWAYRWIGYKGGHVDELLARLCISPQSPVIQNPYSPKTSSLFRRIERVLGKGEPSCDLQASGWLRLILAELVGSRQRSEASAPEPEAQITRQVEQAIRWLTLQYSQQISIEHMAQTLGYHRTHLSKMFKRHTGMSPMQFLLKIRMERARLLLGEPLTVEQVAASVGFPDALYFSKQFKKWYGLAPTDYRQDRLHMGHSCRV
ncbi:AraC family transcriptional regulator [Paenibacillus sp. YN15]|uniref:AraC family transcriptional regulator n=1 Tax=Paenibacillus sp. YN15 TaxID=1742774 RepID=UPI000DCF0CB0|nr:AraC family transcriptional regulator [Paenibacillus sp. YN15]RAV02049.1 AraC family transcriptional regulator [Paenibacillus sp. YN15]